MKNIKTKVLLFGLIMCVLVVLSIFGLTYNDGGTQQTAVVGTTEEMSIETNSNVGTLSLASNDDLTFTLINGGLEYKVGAKNKSLTEANIPAYYNDLPVTEISDMGFMGCSALQKIIILPTVKRIGVNAFMNCTNLTSVQGMAGVEIYGTTAFANCSKLENLILPANITSLGNNLLRGVTNKVYARATEAEMLALNPNYISAGNRIEHTDGLVYETMIDKTTNEFKGYRLLEWQKLPDTVDVDIFTWVFEDEFDIVGGPLLSIAANAFDGSIVENSINLKHLSGHEIEEPVYLEGFAFMNADVAEINILVDVLIGDDAGYFGMGVFYGATATSITLPDTLTTITSYMFADCFNLTEIKNINPNIETNHLSNKILQIEEYAFAKCYSLPNLYIDNTIEYIGENVFNVWGTNPDSGMQTQNVYINLLEAGVWDSLWNGGYNPIRCNIEFTGATEYTVTIDVAQDEVVDAFIGTSSYTVDPNSTLNDIVDMAPPTSTSHNFTGVWYRTAERTPGTEFTADIPIKMNLQLYPGWEIKTFDITFVSNKYFDFYDVDSGTIITEQTLNFDYNEPCKFYIMITNVGYKNYSVIYGNQRFYPNSGNIVSIDITTTGTVTGSAELIIYNIFYANVLNGTNPSHNPRTYTVESSDITFATPSRLGYPNGWWDVPQIKRGTSIGDRTITASWSSPTRYSIKYVMNGGTQNPSGNPTTYTVEDSITLIGPLAAPYAHYASWSRSSIAKGTTGNLTITANVYGNRHTIFLSTGSGLSSPSAPPNALGFRNIAARYGETYTIESIYNNSMEIWATRESDGAEWKLGNCPSITVSNLSASQDDYISLSTRKACVTEGTLITLADGTQKAVELLDGTENLLVWNLLTGQFDTAPILFIDSDASAKYEIINLHFSDGTKVDVISEHGFFDITLNKYVMLDKNAEDYIGHWFNSEDGPVKLKKVKIKTKTTTAWSPVTYGHLCYYVNGMLSMPGATTGLINIFEVDPSTMMYDADAMEADIEEYGLFTYDEFAAIFPIPEEIFNAFNGQYLKVSIGKGLITLEKLGNLIASYAEFFV